MERSASFDARTGIANGRITHDGVRRIVMGIQWENQLAPRFWSEKWTFATHLAAMGVNETSLTVFGGDDTTVNILTAPDDLLAEWRLYLSTLSDLGITPTIYLSEWEHNPGRGRTINRATRLAIAERTLALLAKGNGWGVNTGHVDAILCLGEELDAPLADVLETARFLRARTERLIATHSPLTGDPHVRWADTTRALIAEGLVDVVLMQATQQDIAPRLRYWHSFGVAVVAHEQAPAGPGTAPFDLAAGLAWARAASEVSSGFSIYPGYDRADCNDLHCPRPEIYAPLFSAVGSSRDRILGRDVWGKDSNRDGKIDAGDIAK
jgi:hypothetical protein